MYVHMTVAAQCTDKSSAGNQFQDTVTLGGLVVHGQFIEVMPQGSTGFDGVLGYSQLQYRSRSSTNVSPG